MKRAIILTCCLGIIGFFSCIKMKHEMTIQPIHITVDINLKIDQKLNDFFADIDQAAKDKKEKSEQTPVKKEEKK